MSDESAKSAPQSSDAAIVPTGTPKPRRKFDPRWLAASLALIAVLTTAVVINISHENSGSDKITSAIKTDNGDLKINWDHFETYEINLSELSDNTLSIAKSGIYHLTGTLDDGTININAGAEGIVKLILDNVTIKNNSGPAISCTAGDDLVIELVGDNTLEDGATYASSYDEDVTGAIYSKTDLTFQGDGTLNLTANYQDAIVGKDDVKFNSGIYNILAADDGIRGKDSVYIVAGQFNIEAVGDGIKSTNETDSDKGFILIESGDFSINATAKGIKATNAVLIYGGNFAITTTDDAIHSNNYTCIIDGNFNINSGDDGIHADKELIIDGGDITIVKAYEGLEAQAITINGGKISLTTTDDGINAGGGADSSAMGRPGAGAFDSDEDCVLTINGGEIYVNASGDGVDSNGWIYFNGGTVVVDGPTSNGDGALDSGIGITMSGGTVIAVGSSGMAETLGSTSSVYNASIYLTSVQSAGTKITITDVDGNVVVEHTSAKAFNHIAVGSEDFQLGSTYTIYLNGEKYQDFTISNITTTVGNSNTNQHVMPGGNRR